jgi:hypothetical protein
MVLLGSRFGASGAVPGAVRGSSRAANRPLPLLDPPGPASVAEEVPFVGRRGLRGLVARLGRPAVLAIAIGAVACSSEGSTGAIVMAAPASADTSEAGAEPASAPTATAPVSAAGAEGCGLGRIVCAGACVDPLSNNLHCGACNQACLAGTVCVAGACAIQCAQGQQLCSGACTNVLSDVANCGGCGTLCPAGQFCDNGACSATCSGILCNGPAGPECVDPTSNPSHCGACGFACPAGISCVAGQCTLVCEAPRIACAGQCVDSQSDPANCGACGIVCPAGTPCIGGSCGCLGGLSLCNGQCVDLANDPNHCGACNLSCGAAGLCVGGVCECPGDETLCDGQCVDTQANSSHCGACGVVCAPEQVCSGGVCSAAGCAGNTVQCGTDCVDTMTDRAHCGGCDLACAEGLVCEGGVCTCPGGTTLCNEACVDTATHPAHCGACNTACPGGASCVGGVCECPADTSECNGTCINFTDNDAHCGSCNAACPQGQSCVGTSCECPNGGTYCEDSCVDLQTSNENCGECGRTCVGGQFCDAGTCACESPLVLCGELCVDLQTSSEHCGSCDAPCAAGRTCIDGVCGGIVGDGPDGCGGAAHSITIDRVVLYQAVEVALMESGSPIGIGSRNADVVQGRDAVFRVFVSLESGWSAREVSVRVHVTTNGEEHTLYTLQAPNGSSSQADLASTIQVQVEGELIGLDTRYALEIVECVAGSDGVLASPRFPAEGDTELGARPTGPVKITFVPVPVDSWTPDTSEGALDVYRGYLQAMYPATEIITSVTNSLPVSPGFDWTTLLDQIRDRRAQESPTEDVYYFGLVRPTETMGEYCRGGCTAGVGYVTDTGRFAADYRAACGLAFGDEESATTMAHELGHNHGREHSPCNVSGDPAYPYSGGLIGSWGFDSRTGSLLDPARYADIMGYCSPAWVSDWTYQAFLERIATVNGAVSARVLSAADAALRWRVLLLEPGNIRWGLPYREAKPPAGHPEEARALAADGTVLATVTVYATPTSLHSMTSYLVPPPEPSWHAIQIGSGPVVAYP